MSSACIAALVGARSNPGPDTPERLRVSRQNQPLETIFSIAVDCEAVAHGEDSVTVRVCGAVSGTGTRHASSHPRSPTWANNEFKTGFAARLSLLYVRSVCLFRSVPCFTSVHHAALAHSS